MSYRFKSQHSLIVTFLTMFMILYFASCGPKQGGAGWEGSSTVIAYDLKAEGNDKGMSISWKKRGNGSISGYLIYIEKTLIPTDVTEFAQLTPFNSEPFPGDTSPEDGIEHFIADGLENSTLYHVTVRVLFPDGSQSKPYETIKVVCGPRGDIELAVRYAAENDGYSFAENMYVSADGATNDLYYFVKKGKDMLGSPKRLSGFNRDSHFIKINESDSLEEITNKMKVSPPEPELDILEVKSGDWIFVKSEDGGHALLKIIGFSGEGKARQIKLMFIYNGYSEELIF